MIQTIESQPRIENCGSPRTGIQRRIWIWRIQGWALQWDIGQRPDETDLAIHAFCPNPSTTPGDLYLAHKAKCPWKLGRWAGRWEWRKVA